LIKIKDFRGVEIEIKNALYLHVKKRHPDVFRILGISSESSFIQVIKKAVKNPSEVYKNDARKPLLWWGDEWRR